MPFQSKNGQKPRASDADYVPPPSVAKRIKMAAHSSVQQASASSSNDEDDRDDPLPPSSAPASPTFWGDNNEPLIDETPVRAPLPETPPASPSGGAPLTSPFLPSPLKPYGGRSRVTRPHRNARGVRSLKQLAALCQWGPGDLQKAQEEAASVDAQMLQLQEATERDQAKQDEISSALRQLTSDGTPMHRIFQLLFAAPNAEDASKTTRMVTEVLRTHGPELLEKWADRAPQAVDALLPNVLQREALIHFNKLT
ncbi:hypothetical protein K438DRAFT_1765145 [Mycena galopus ATCC 62051]|nr:hypothetical protein K438DRAFT_1765145 [Mycena galopus ATCC 62051]